MTTTAVKALEYLFSDCSFEAGRLRDEIKKWLDEQSANLAKGGLSLAYGFEWADKVTATSVKLEVVETILAWADGASLEGMSDEEAEAEAARRLKMVAQESMKKALECARSPVRSTSAMSRLIGELRTEAWAQQVSGWNARLTKWL